MSTSPASRIQSRRRLIVFILLGAALVGAVIRQFTDRASLIHDLGTLLLVLWVPAVGNIIGHLLERWAPKRGKPGFDAALPFAAERQATLRFDAPPPDLTQPLACTLLQGSEGFTARLRATAAGGADVDGAAAAQAVELQFLVPAVALQRFAPGADFRIVLGQAVVGEGRVC